MSFFDKILGSKYDDEPLEAQKNDVANLSPLQEACDEIPNTKGSFGYSETNPIPVNGIEGERVYLFRLKAKSGAGVFYHRLGSINMTKQINQTVDIFEVVAIDGSQWATLYFCMYFPRRSMKYPEGFSLKPWNSIDKEGKVFCKLPGYGSFSKVNNFPLGLPDVLENHPGLKRARMGSILAATIRKLLSRNKGSWQRSDDQTNKMMGIQVDGFTTTKKDGSLQAVEKIKAPPEPDPALVNPPTSEQLPADSLYVYIKDEPKGPFTVDQLKALLTVETIRLESLCCHEGAQTWKTVNDYISSSQQNPNSWSRN